jgi:hypothetical protein
MHEILEPVALSRDIPVAGLRCSDIGAIVEVHDADADRCEGLGSCSEVDCFRVGCLEAG